MAGFLETFVDYLDRIGPDPIKDAAERVRADQSRHPVDREALARDMERINGVIGLGGPE